LTISRGPCRALGLACSPEPPLHHHAVVPYGFHRPVRWLTRKHLSRLPPSETGIRLAVLHGAPFLSKGRPHTASMWPCKHTLCTGRLACAISRARQPGLQSFSGQAANSGAVGPIRPLIPKAMSRLGLDQCRVPGARAQTSWGRRSGGRPSLSAVLPDLAR